MPCYRCYDRAFEHYIRKVGVHCLDCIQRLGIHCLSCDSASNPRRLKILLNNKPVVFEHKYSPSKYFNSKMRARKARPRIVKYYLPHEKRRARKARPRKK